MIIDRRPLVSIHNY